MTDNVFWPLQRPEDIPKNQTNWPTFAPPQWQTFTPPLTIGEVEWCIVRPDTLINGPVSDYEIVPAPTTGIFSGRPTTRANVAHFMKTLLEDRELWAEWKFNAPVIMNDN